MGVGCVFPRRSTFKNTELTFGSILILILDILIGPCLKRLKGFLVWLILQTRRKRKKERKEGRKNNQVTINTSLSGIDRVWFARSI